ncbi:MAG: Gfo/Idh/MocA family oxidoreductase [Agriterribacter sp.]
MKHNFYRRAFIRKSAILSAGLVFTSPVSTYPESKPAGTRVGIIGLDTSHCIAFTKSFNSPNAGPEFGGYKVVAAYPTPGSSDIPSSINRVATLTEQVKQEGVEIVSSIDELLKKVDFVLLETIDGRKHLEQALPVIKAGKPMFIDKPMAASLHDGIAIFNAAKQYNTPVFSSSSVRYIEGAEELKGGKIGKVRGVDTYGLASIEKTHPDMFWYGIHGIEALFAIMGTGCKEVIRVSANDADIIVGTWEDGRLCSYRGTRYPKGTFGGTVFGDEGIAVLGEWKGYNPLLIKIVDFFKTGKVPVSPEETLEILAFMEAAEESKMKGGMPVSIQSIIERAKNNNNKR